VSAILFGLLGVLLLLRALLTLAGAAAGCWATVLALGGSVLLGTLLLDPSPAAAGGFLLASLAVLMLVRWRRVPAAHPAFGLTLLALAAWNPVLGVASFGRAQLMASLWSPLGGLLYRSPSLWLGWLGLLALARRDRRLSVTLLLSLAAALTLESFQRGVGSGAAEPTARSVILIPPLAVGLAEALRWLQGLARRRSGGLLLAGALLLSLGNLLFMEQYRRELIPRDDTVSFARVAENGAGLLARAVGSPLGWPANWLFAWRHALPPDRYDAMAGRRLVAEDRAFAVIEVGDRATEESALAEGWSVRHPCGSRVCRQLEGRARLFVGLEEPASLAITLRSSGESALQIAVNGRGVGVMALSGRLEECRLLVPADAWRRDLNEIVLSAAPGSAVLVDRIRFERPWP